MQRTTEPESNLLTCAVVSLVLLITVTTFGLIDLVRAATTTVDLGNADGFAILANSTITNTGTTVITGDLGLSPGTAVTGFPPGTVNGTQHINDLAAANAQSALTAAYLDAAGRTPVVTIGTELGTTTLNDGVYNSADGTFQITGTLILDGLGDPDAVFIFKMATTLTTAVASNIVLTGEAQACNVFWQVGSSATLGTGSSFVGNIMASESVTLTTGASVEGRVLAQNAAVTLDSNTVTLATCAAPTPTPTPTPTETPSPTPTPTESPTPTPTETPSPTPTESPSPTASATATPTPTVTVDNSAVLSDASGPLGKKPNIHWEMLLLVSAGLSTATAVFSISADKYKAQSRKSM